jgi:hypothetical protein
VVPLSAAALPAGPPVTWPGDPAAADQGLATPGSVVAPEHREPPLPRSLGGLGLTGAPENTGSPDDDRVGPARLVIRTIGLAMWLLVGFRIGVQGLGGPVGIGLFLAVVAGVALLGRRLTER